MCNNDIRSSIGILELLVKFMQNDPNVSAKGMKYINIRNYE